MQQAMFVLFVADPARSRAFYAALLGREPKLEEPGMCEFLLAGGGSLGLMPSTGAAALFGSAVPGAGETGTPPRSELYLRLPDADAALARAESAGGKLALSMAERSWGEEVAYLTDPDGHVVGIARYAADPMGPASAAHTEAEVLATEEGLSPKGPGWFVTNLKDARWFRNPRFGAFCSFEGDARFQGFGTNVHLLDPGQPACLYHREDSQEGFLVLRGTCLVVIEGQERSLRAWDYVHCPAGTTHVFVGTGDEPCAILMIGRREAVGRLFYPQSELAAAHGASSEADTPDPRQAYAGTAPSEPIPSPWE